MTQVPSEGDGILVGDAPKSRLEMNLGRHLHTPIVLFALSRVHMPREALIQPESALPPAVLLRDREEDPPKKD